MSKLQNVKTSRDRCERAQNASEVLRLRLTGLNFEEIGERMGFSRQRAHAIVTEELGRINAERNESALELRRLEAERLDALQTAVWPMASVGYLPAVDRVLRIMERRARLLGLDAQPNVMHPDEVFQLVRALVAAVNDCVTDPDTLRAIRDNLAAAMGRTLPGDVGETLSEIDREIDSDRDDRSCENLVDPG